MIKMGDTLPAGTLYEFNEIESEGCPVGPLPVQLPDAARGKKIAIFGLPGAFTPTCSAKHVPGYVALHAQFKAKGIAEIWCMSVNDAFVMGAWGREQKAAGKVRMLGDGSGLIARAMGLELDLVARGLGMRMQRFSALVDDGVVTRFNLEAPGQFEVSGAEALLAQI